MILNHHGLKGINDWQLVNLCDIVTTIIWQGVSEHYKQEYNSHFINLKVFYCYEY